MDASSAAPTLAAADRCGRMRAGAGLLVGAGFRVPFGGMAAELEAEWV